MCREWVREVFIEKAHLFLEVMEYNEEKGIREAEGIAKALKNYGVEEKSRVLELGCGSGRVAIPLAKKGYLLTCLDISPLYVEKAKEKARKEGITNFRAIVADAWRIDEFFKKEFDAAYMTWSTLLGYSTKQRDELLLRKTRKVVKENGKLIIANTVNKELVTVRKTHGYPENIINYLNELVVLEHVSYDPVNSMLRSTWKFYRKRGQDLIYAGEFSFDLHLYSLSEIVEMAIENGWELVGAYHDFIKFEPYIPGKSPLNLVLRKKA